VITREESCQGWYFQKRPGGGGGGALAKCKISAN